MATAFLGFYFSPRWLDISNKDNITNKGNISNYRVNKRLFYKNILKRGYCTTSYLNNPAISKRLQTILNGLGINPVYTYEDLNIEDIRKQILNNTRGLSGIYMIINKTTKDYYIGSASTNRFYARFCNHIIHFTGSKIVKLAIKKYGLKNFAFVVLDLYPNIVTKENNKELLDLEDKYLKLLVPNYNILTEAGFSFGYKHTEIDRQNMNDFYSDVRRKTIGNINTRAKFSPEIIEKMREKALTKPHMAEETKEKCISITRPVVLYNFDKTIYGKYSTIIEAANAINCSKKTLEKALQKKRILLKNQ
jgi:group I intron endonuclease